MKQDLFDEIRAASREVASRAANVRIVKSRLAPFTHELVAHPPKEDADPARRPFESIETTLAFVITMDAINFGSGWFPVLHKPEGKSGYRTVASALERRFLAHGAFRASELQSLDVAACCKLFDQTPGSAAEELMAHFAGALSDLGRFLETRFEGSFKNLVEAGQQDIATFVALLDEMPRYRDVASYDELRVPFYKRAQITAWDLSIAFGGEGPGRFDDLDRLTLFADNLVPHVLRRAGVLEYTDDLARRIDSGELLVVGARDEVEIRASALHAVECCVAIARDAGHDVNAAQLDGWLWNRGQEPVMKAYPRHRARSVFY